MNSPHTVFYAVIAFMLFSSVVSILYVTIQNHRAVKRYYKNLTVDKLAEQSVDYSYVSEDYEGVHFFQQKVEKTRA